MSELQGFGFVLPHWLYWGWLAVMPLAMILWSRWQERRGEAGREVPDVGLVIDYLAEEWRYRGP